MPPLAHHAGEDTLLSLLVLGGSGLSVAAAIARAWLATTRARLTRRGGRQDPTSRHRGSVAP